jgi:prepilin-type N-terminal cleavage/methylation domain-containing protein
MKEAARHQSLLVARDTVMRGFNVMELLVVIAVIAVLSALIMPVLARTKERKQRSVCLGNLRQVYVRANAYAGDNHELLFQARSNNKDLTQWIQISIDPVLGLAGMDGMPDYTALPGLSQTNEGKTIWSCPNRPGFPVYQPGYADDDSTVAPGQVVLGYQYFGGITYWNNKEGAFPDAPSPIKTTKSQPWWVLAADAIMYVDQAWGGSDPGDAEGQFVFANMPSHSPNQRPDGGHEVFMDGSAAWQEFNTMHALTTWGSSTPSVNGQRDCYFYQNPIDFSGPLRASLQYLTPAAMGE